MKCSRRSPSSASMICSSCPVPSVATHSAWVSPRVNRAEPWARGSMPTSATIGRTVLVSRPSMRMPVSRMAARTTSASSSLSSGLAASALRPSSLRARDTAFLMEWTLLLPVLLDLLAGRPRPARCGRAPSMRAFSSAVPATGSASGPGLLGGVLGQLDDRGDHRADGVVAEGDGAEHDLLRQLLRLGSRPSARPRWCRP